MAARRSSFTSRARNTTPIPPRPSSRSSVNCPRSACWKAPRSASKTGMPPIYGRGGSCGQHIGGHVDCPTAPRRSRGGNLATKRGTVRESLSKYREKRDFKKTAEPAGGTKPPVRRRHKLRFVIQKH